MAREVEGCLTSFGAQTLSTKPSGPKAGFGSSGRIDAVGDKPFELRRLGATSKGVTTEVKSGFGLQQASTNVNSPSIRFGNRYASDIDMVKEARPGPGSYGTVDAVGKQVLSPNQTMPEVRIGTGGRFGQFKTLFKKDFETPAAGDPRPTSGWLGDKPKYSFHGQGRRSDITKGLSANTPSFCADPGPGSYEPNPSSLSVQSDSRKPTSQRTRVGTADRDQRYTLYVSPAHEKDLFGKHSPAPNQYSPDLKVSSRVRSPQRFGFGSGDRFSEVKSENGRNLKVWTPGPGAYVV